MDLLPILYWFNNWKLRLYSWNIFYNWYNSSVVIYTQRAFIRLATAYNKVLCLLTFYLTKRNQVNNLAPLRSIKLPRFDLLSRPSEFTWAHSATKNSQPNISIICLSRSRYDKLDTDKKPDYFDSNNRDFKWLPRYKHG